MVGHGRRAFMYMLPLVSGPDILRMYMRMRVAFLLVYYCGAHDSSGASSTSLAEGMSPTKS